MEMAPMRIIKYLRKNLMLPNEIYFLFKGNKKLLAKKYQNLIYSLKKRIDRENENS
jgi:hypothetical protein